MKIYDFELLLKIVNNLEVSVNSAIIKRTFVLLFIFSLFTFFFSCQPISSEEDAQNFSNAMIKAFFVGDEEYNKNKSSELEKTITLTSTGVTPTDFANSHFSGSITDGYDLVKIIFSNSEISYEDSTYIVNGILYCALDVTTNIEGVQGTIILYGSLEVTKDGKNQDILFDAKYTLTFTFTDENHDNIYDYSLTGSIQTYVNDFVVNDSNWSITFSGKIFIA